VVCGDQYFFFENAELKLFWNHIFAGNRGVFYYGPLVQFFHSINALTKDVILSYIFTDCLHMNVNEDCVS